MGRLLPARCRGINKVSLSLSNWGEISFPVYRVPLGHTLKVEGTVTYSYKEYKDQESMEVKPSIRFLDDTSLAGDTLGKRRIQILQNGGKLLRLPRGIYFLGDLVKLASSGVQFVDSNGLLFKYKKTTRVPLIFKKIVRKLAIPNSIGTIIEVEGIPTRFKSSCSLSYEDKFVGLLKLGAGYILYAVYQELYDTTNRKV